MHSKRQFMQQASGNQSFYEHGTNPKLQDMHASSTDLLHKYEESMHAEPNIFMSDTFLRMAHQTREGGVHNMLRGKKCTPATQSFATIDEKEKEDVAPSRVSSRPGSAVTAKKRPMSATSASSSTRPVSRPRSALPQSNVSKQLQDIITMSKIASKVLRKKGVSVDLFVKGIKSER